MNRILVITLVTLISCMFINNCQKEKPFGELLGETNGVKAYSSYNHYNPNDSNYINNIFTGIK